jgi:lysophospholipase L1-like esterase
MRKTKPVVILLITSNIISLFFLLLISSHYDVPTKVLNKLVRLTSSSYASPSNGHAVKYKYTDNPTYMGKTSLFQIYKPKQIKIVMLGDSITFDTDWNELLTRTDVANRGIGGDITEGFINRLSDVYSLNPEVCFIMGGINDLGKGIAVNEVFQNYTNIVKSLRSYGITPIIQSTLYLSEKHSNWKLINNKVDELNTMLKEYAKKEGIAFMEVNRELSKGGALDSIYTYDGIHLDGRGYAKWRDLILLTLRNDQ